MNLLAWAQDPLCDGILTSQTRGNNYISCDSEQQQPQGRFPRPEVPGRTDKVGEKLVPLSLLNYVAQSESSQSDSPIELKAGELPLGYLEDKSSQIYHKPD